MKPPISDAFQTPRVAVRGLVALAASLPCASCDGVPGGAGLSALHDATVHVQLAGTEWEDSHEPQLSVEIRYVSRPNSLAACKELTPNLRVEVDGVSMEIDDYGTNYPASWSLYGTVDPCTFPTMHLLVADFPKDVSPGDAALTIDDGRDTWSVGLWAPLVPRGLTFDPYEEPVALTPGAAIAATYSVDGEDLPEPTLSAATVAGTQLFRADATMDGAAFVGTVPAYDAWDAVIPGPARVGAWGVLVISPTACDGPDACDVVGPSNFGSVLDADVDEGGAE